MNIYWQHLTGQKCSPKFDTPESLLEFSDRYFEDYCIPHGGHFIMLKTVGMRHCTPDYRLVNHCAPRHVFHYIIAGEAWCNGRPVCAGDVIYFKRNIPYNFSSNFANPCYYAWVTFDGELCENYLKYMGIAERYRIFHTDNMPKLCEILYDMLYVSHPGADIPLYLESAFFHLLSLTAPDGSTEKFLTRDKKPDVRVQTALKYISDHYTSPDFRVHDVSDSLRMSEKHFRILFKKETGTTVRDYLNQTRIDAARELLLNSNYTISEISEMAGFSDYRRFFDLFRKKLGVSPQQFKNQRFQNISGDDEE